MIALPNPRLQAYDHSFRAVLALLVCAALGVCAVVQPMLALAVAALFYLILRGGSVLREVLLVLVIGNMTLNYGFANLGLNLAGLPLPMTDLLLIGIVVWCLSFRVSLKEMGAPALFMVAILALATVRLVADFPAYGNLAARDFSTPLETITLVVGYFAFKEYGLRWASRFWFIVSLAVLGYGMLFPMRDQLLTMGPVVGLQQQVSLLGHFAGVGCAVGSAFLFFLLRVRPPWALVLGAACLAVLILFQSRGLYLGVPATLVIVLIAGERLRTGLASRLLGSLVVGVLLLAVILPMSPEGRMGPVSVSFITAQIGTLFGQEGPGDGSYDDRLEWLATVREKQSDDPLSLVWGLGLGPDLTGGATGGVEFIRKPHNDYVEIFARFGFLGAALWGGLLVSLLYSLWCGVRSKSLSQDERTFLLWLVGSSSLYMFISATQPLMAYAYGTLPLFMMLGMGLALVRGRPARQEQAGESNKAPVFDHVGLSLGASRS
ncbi:MAG TPA: O-antigen ligase family protein [Dehalococcoidia bacterium]|nr:O-antigen ligase family protein [Dehalococcoidia bacterium]